MNKEKDLKHKISALKKKKNAVILAHYYQTGPIQDVADFVGDSLGLSQQAQKTNADLIVFAGVYFMAETAKILNPSKKVVLPDLNAGCSLADACSPEDFKTFIRKYPNHVVVTYVNCSAEIKALSDIVCTSSNAIKVIESIPKDQGILFAPDKNLGAYLEQQTQRKMVLWDGSCVVHEAFSIEKLIKLKLEHPQAKIIAHPESEEHILKLANFIGSTSEMLKYVRTDTSKEYIVATEAGILHQMTLESAHKTFFPAPSKESNTCACSECAYMKVNTLEKLYLCLKNESPEIFLSDYIIEQASLPLQRMLSLSEK